MWFFLSGSFSQNESLLVAISTRAWWDRFCFVQIGGLSDFCVCHVRFLVGFVNGIKKLQTQYPFAMMPAFFATRHLDVVDVFCQEFGIPTEVWTFPTIPPYFSSFRSHNSPARGWPYKIALGENCWVIGLVPICRMTITREPKPNCVSIPSSGSFSNRGASFSLTCVLAETASLASRRRDTVFTTFAVFFEMRMVLVQRRLLGLLAARMEYSTNSECFRVQKSINALNCNAFFVLSCTYDVCHELSIRSKPANS